MRLSVDLRTRKNNVNRLAIINVYGVDQALTALLSSIHQRNSKLPPWRIAALERSHRPVPLKLSCRAWWCCRRFVANEVSTASRLWPMPIKLDCGESRLGSKIIRRSPKRLLKSTRTKRRELDQGGSLWSSYYEFRITQLKMERLRFPG